jgi:hypothetical protein
MSVDLFNMAEDWEGRRREYEVDGQGYILEAEDPYGFWKISWKKGRTPDKIADQRFTDFSYARDALILYLEEQSRVKPVEKEETKKAS